MIVQAIEKKQRILEEKKKALHLTVLIVVFDGG